jgi:hypothetical protein
MEESKELQGFYKIFRAAVYVSVLLEFFAYAIDPATLDHWGGILCDIHSRIKRWMIYTDGNLVYSKAATVLLICITCIGTRNKKHLEFDAKRQVLLPIIFGLSLLVLSVWLFGRPMELRLYTLPLNVILYMAASVAGVVLVHIALDNISKFIKEGLMKDRFNFENESFEQCEELIENRYSVNIPMRYYYKGKFRKGWVNISNCFRGTWVVGTPGSGKTMSIIEPFIRQHSAKGFAMVAYDYKFPTLATKLYYHYLKNKRLGKTPPNCKFNMINFVDVEYSRRVNPIQAKYINNLAAASETAETLLESLQKGKKEGGGGSDQFFQIVGRQFGILLHAAFGLLLLDEHLERIVILLRLGLHTQHHVAVHLYEAAIGIPCKTRIARALGHSLDGHVVHAEVQNRIHHTRHRRAGARTHRDQQRHGLVAEAHVRELLDVFHRTLHFGAQQLDDLILSVSVILRTYLRRDRKARGNGNADEIHLGQIGTLTAQQLAHLAISLGGLVAEGINTFYICHNS